MTVECIFIDLDGTLYDLDDVIRGVYRMQVDFLKEYTDMTEAQIVSWFEENHVYPYKTPQACSATALFAEAGVDKQTWSRYKDEHLDVSDVTPIDGICDDLLKALSTVAPVVLVSSNTMSNIEKILKQLGLSPTVFADVVSSDTAPCQGAFHKKAVFERLAKERSVPLSQTVSIGDRYATDIEPLLQLGGTGILLHTPGALSSLCTALQKDSLCSCDGYTVYRP